MENRNLNPNLLDDLALVVARSEIVEINDLLDIRLHVTNELELDIGLEESSGDLVEAVVERFLVDHRRVAHLLNGTRYAPSQLRQHHRESIGRRTTMFFRSSNRNLSRKRLS